VGNGEFAPDEFDEVSAEATAGPLPRFLYTKSSMKSSMKVSSVLDEYRTVIQ
jgi:hypothetical protein